MDVPHLRLRIPAVDANVPLARHAVLAFTAAQGADEELQGRIALALTEAAANVVVHAYRDRAEAGMLTVTVDACDGDLQIVVEDEGTGLTAGYGSAGLGLGLAIASDVCEELVVSDRWPSGVEIFMSFALARDGS